MSHTDLFVLPSAGIAVLKNEALDTFVFSSVSHLEKPITKTLNMPDKCKFNPAWLQMDLYSECLLTPPNQLVEATHDQQLLGLKLGLPSLLRATV